MKNSNLNRELLILVLNTQFYNLELVGEIPDYSSKFLQCSSPRVFQ